MQNKSGRKYTIYSCIYRHPSIEIEEFKDTFLQALLEKCSHKNENVISMGDFNIDILKYNTNGDSENFLDNMYANFALYPHRGESYLKS